MMRKIHAILGAAVISCASFSVFAEQSWSQEDLLKMKRQAEALQTQARDYMAGNTTTMKTGIAQSWSLEDIKKIATQAKQTDAFSEPAGDIMPWKRMLSGMSQAIKGQRMEDSEKMIADLLAAKKNDARYANGTGLLPKHHRLEVFVSWGMSITELREIFLEAAGNPAIRILFRGVPEGMSINGAMAKLKSQIGDLKTPPDIRIDPKAFRKFAVEYVPQAVLYKNETGTEEVSSKIRGLSNLERAVEIMIEQGESPESYGPTIKIEEPDLIEEMTRRMRNLDMNALKQKAYSNYWEKKQFYRLAPAERERVRELDPTVTVQKPIVDHKGRVLVKANRSFNPLKVKPFTHRMIIFDGTDPKQTIIAAKITKDTPKNLKPVLMTTALDRSKGWYALKTLEEQINAPVYLLTPEIIQRWQLEKVPAFVQAKGLKFIIHEVPVKEENL